MQCGAHEISCSGSRIMKMVSFTMTILPCVSRGEG